MADEKDASKKPDSEKSGTGKELAPVKRGAKPIQLDDTPDVKLEDSMWAMRIVDDASAYSGIQRLLAQSNLSASQPSALKKLKQRVADALEFGPDTWIAEWGGQGLGHKLFDLSALLEIVQPYANAVRWYARSLFEGGNEIGFPGARAALSGSLVLVLGPSLTEQPREIKERSIYATVEGGRLVTATMAAANEQDALTGIFRPLSKNAAKAYVSTLEVMVDRQLSVTSYLEVDEKPRTVRFVMEQARDDLAWLSKPPPTTTYDQEVFGVFRAVDDRNEGHFALEVEAKKEARGAAEVITGVIASELRHVPLTTRRRVRAVLRITEPTETWMPRAPRTRRVLREFEPAPLRERAS